MAASTQTGGRAATGAVIGGGFAVAVGLPQVEPPAGFEWRPLSQVARLESGHTPSRRHPEYWNGGIPWIGIKDATANHGRTIETTFQSVTQAGIDNSSARMLPAGTVCLSRTASVGYVVVMGQPMATSQDFVNWVCGPELDARYLKFVLQSDREALLRFASGSTHQTIYFPEVKAFHVLMPSVAEQRRIAATLGALDDKIESNDRASSKAVLLAQQLLSRPGRRVRVGDIANLRKGLSYKGAGLRVSAGPDTTPMFNLGNFTMSGMHKPSSMKHYAGQFKAKHLLHSGALVVANTDLTQARDLLGRGFLVPPDAEGALHTHHTSVVTFDDGLDAAPFLWAQLQGQEFRDRALGFATGTTVSALPAEALLDFEIELPDNHEAVREDALPLIQLSWALQRQSASASTLRDALLPELLSGRVRVPEAREAVAEAVS